MAYSYAENYSSSDQSRSDKVTALRTEASDVAENVSKEARTLVDQVAAYTKANPIEAAAIAAGVAFVAGAIIFAPRLMQSRHERDFDRLVRKAYREADRVRDQSSASWDRLTDWVRANVPSPNIWR